MRFVLALLAVIGIAASALALREHYRTDTSPCSINERWDCGIVNHSPYAVLWGVPVAAIGIAGYLLLGILALKRRYWRLVAVVVGRAGVLALPGAHREGLLGVWCIYCVASLGVISVFSLLVLGAVLRGGGFDTSCEGSRGPHWFHCNPSQICSLYDQASQPCTLIFLSAASNSSLFGAWSNG